MTVELPREHERGTRTLFGKPYHWRVINGRYSLLPGPDPDIEIPDHWPAVVSPGSADG